MKILTWNVYKDNKKIESLVGRVKKENADVVCLQEVPEEHASKFKDLYPHAVYSHEGWTYKKTGKRVRILNMILSQYKLTNVFVHDLSLEKIFTAKRYSQFSSEFISATFEHNNKKYQVSNTHLRCVAPPWVRVRQFEEMLKRIDMKNQNIICGDLNTFSWPLLNILLWKKYNYSAKELLANGRKIFESIFEKHELYNPHPGVGTFKLFPVQYDYILVNKNTKIVEAEKIKELHGSDHYALVLDID